MNSSDVRFYLATFLERLPIFLAVAFIVASCGVALAYWLPPLYRATAKILVESPQIPTDLARSTVPENAVAQLQIVQQEMLTRDALLSLANRFPIYADRHDFSDADIVEDMHARIRIDPLLMDASGNGSGATAFSVSFDAGDASVAADVANSLVTTILDRDAANRASRAADTLMFFTREVDRLGHALKGIETEILAFKNSNLDALPDSLDFRRSLQSNMQERLLMLEREESSLKNRRSTLVQLFRNTGRVLDGGAQTPKGRLLENLNAALASQSTIFAEDSPTIQALRARISSVAGDLETTKPNADAAATKLPPSELDIQLADIDDRLTTIASEKESISQTAATTDASIQATPENETTLNALERGYQNTQSQYNAAVARLAEASTGEQIESRLKGQRLSLIEAATPPPRPFSPKRPLIAGFGALAGIGLGAAIVVLMELLNRKVRRPIEIERALGIEPLATIPFIRVKAMNWKRRALTLVALAVVAASIPILHNIAMPGNNPLDELLRSAFMRMGAGA
jgi:polysaccharide chain length determinant protein (PEP-CTERM system associated)